MTGGGGRTLFAEPCDAAQFDFSKSLVVLMGGGLVANGSFDISGVEEAVRVDHPSHFRGVVVDRGARRPARAGPFPVQAGHLA